jgi:hypothetical protein
MATVHVGANTDPHPSIILACTGQPLLTLEQRAELAGRADIRHNHTSYEDQLADADLHGDDWLYVEIKATAHDAVDDFLQQHRQT